MSGPIVRLGTNPKFWDGWDKIYGEGAKASARKTPAKAAAKKAAKKAPKKAAGRKPAKKK